MKRWSEEHGYYGDTGIRVVVTEKGVLTVDGTREVNPGPYTMSDANDDNVYLSNDRDPTYIVRCSDLIEKHELVSPYLHDWNTDDDVCLAA